MASEASFYCLIVAILLPLIAGQGTVSALPFPWALVPCTQFGVVAELRPGNSCRLNLTSVSCDSISAPKFLLEGLVPSQVECGKIPEVKLCDNSTEYPTYHFNCTVVPLASRNGRCDYNVEIDKRCNGTTENSEGGFGQGDCNNPGQLN